MRSAGSKRPAQGGGSQRTQQLTLAAQQLPAIPAAGRRSRLERVQTHTRAGRHADRRGGAGRRQGPVLTFRVDDPCLAAEDMLAPQERFDEAGLASPDLADDQHVGIGQPARAVQLPRVIDKGPAEEVTADVDTPRAQSAFGQKRVQRLQMGGRRSMRRRGAHRPIHPAGCAVTTVGHDSPRASGKVHVNASSCWPNSRRSSRWARRAACSTSAQASSSSIRSAAVTVR